MMDHLAHFWHVLLATGLDVLPIVLIIVVFQVGVLRRPLPHLRRQLIGFSYVLLGLTFFLVGLDEALFPLGEIMAQQLTAPSVIGANTANSWTAYLWVYVFAATIGFATTVAEPALIAVSIKAHEVSGGAINVWGLRMAVAIGVAIGIALGVFRIVSGIPLQYFIISGYILVVIQTAYAPRSIIALAYDSGGVTTSTVTVPLVTALGLGLASNVPGRSPMLDGFGLIAFASLIPIITVMGYAQLGQWRAHRKARQSDKLTGE